jgi:hypothetical protein
MLQVIVTRGLRGTETYRARDRQDAERTVRKIIASAIHEDRTTTFARLDEDRADAWQIKTGKYHGDVIQIVSVTGDRKGQNYYNLAANVNALSRADKPTERELSLTSMRRKMDTAGNMKQAAKDQTKNGRMDFPCKFCKGTGKAKAEAELGFVLLPSQTRRRAFEYRKTAIYSHNCPACKGTGERE